MKTIKYINTTVRKLSQSSLGITLPKELVDREEIVEGDSVLIPIMYINDEEIEYRCKVCGAISSFRESEDPYCVVCNEENLERREIQ